jgi:hypothetical protein
LHAPVTDGEHDEDIENDERDVDHGAHRIRGITPDFAMLNQDEIGGDNFPNIRRAGIVNERN